MTTRLGRSLMLSLLFIGALLFPTSATVTAFFEERFLPAGATLDYDFTPSTTGEIRVRVSLQPSQVGAVTRLLRKGEEKPVVEQSGPLPHTLTANVTEADVGRTWLLVITNNHNQQSLTGRIELTFPRLYCKDINGQYRVKVSYEAGTEIEDIHCMQLLSVLNSLPSDHLRRLREIRARPPSAFIYGQYFPPSLVELPGLRAGRTFILVSYHELGHLVHFTRASTEQFERWEKLFKESGRDIDNFALDPINRSLYAMTNQYEDFAVTYSAYIAQTQLYIQEAITRSQRDKTLLLQKFKLMTEFFRHAVENQLRVYIYRVGTEAPTPKIERASVPLTAENLPDFTAPAQWECFGLCN